MADLEAVINYETNAEMENDAVTSQTAAEYTQTNETDATKSTDAASDPQITSNSMARETSETTSSPTQNNSAIEDDEICPSDWPPTVHDHIAANFSDGFYIGEVLEVIDDDTVKVSYMAPKKILTAAPTENKQRFWIWPAKRDVYDTQRNCVINLRPNLLLESPASSKRHFVFSCINAELSEVFANSVTEEEDN